MQTSSKGKNILNWWKPSQAHECSTSVCLSVHARNSPSCVYTQVTQRQRNPLTVWQQSSLQRKADRANHASKRVYPINLLRSPSSTLCGDKPSRSVDHHILSDQRTATPTHHIFPPHPPTAKSLQMEKRVVGLNSVHLPNEWSTWGCPSHGKGLILAQRTLPRTGPAAPCSSWPRLSQPGQPGVTAKDEAHTPTRRARLSACPALLGEVLPHCTLPKATYFLRFSLF